MGTSQLSGSPTLNTTSQTIEGIPSSNLEDFPLLRELPLILLFLPVLRVTMARDPLASGKWKITVLCHLSGQWRTVSLRTPKLWGKRNFHECKQTWEALLQVGTKEGRRGHFRRWLLQNISVVGKLALLYVIDLSLNEVVIFRNNIMHPGTYLIDDVGFCKPILWTSVFHILAYLVLYQ